MRPRQRFSAAGVDTIEDQDCGSALRCRLRFIWVSSSSLS